MKTKQFSNRQIEFMKKIGLDVEKNEVDESEIEGIVSENLQKNGFDENYNITPDGTMCESILDLL